MEERFIATIVFFHLKITIRNSCFPCKGATQHKFGEDYAQINIHLDCKKMSWLRRL